jgi:hypothetical protein
MLLHNNIQYSMVKWKNLHVHIQGEEKQTVVKKKIKSWAGRDDGGGRRTRTGFHTRDQQLVLGKSLTLGIRSDSTLCPIF